ncbi:hypothetical protein BD769DRAFT_711451 [Suillus cothurnatus]|nr:hypothetical protein BD769DRAFT_711451 [Suillus cothurnatus]
MSSSSSNSTVLVTATGVLVDPRLSCVLRVNENTPIESLLRELSQKLTIQYNDFIKPIPPIELGPFDILIGSVDRDMDRQKPISTLSNPQSENSITIHFKMPKPYAFHTLLSENKENLAQLEESLRLAQTSSKSAQREKKADLLASGSVENKSPGETRRQEMDDLRRELMGEINGLKASRTKQDERIKGQDERIKDQDERIKDQDERIKDLEASNAELLASNSELRASNSELRASNTQLSTSIKEMSTTLQRHSTVLHALHRRVLLDDARVLLSDTYAIPVDELRPGGQVTSGKPKTLQQLVMYVRSKLSQDDAHWLHENALKMIFDSSSGTLRSGGNAAAHHASKDDLRLAINDPGLTALQTATLKNIYAFTNSGILDI